MNLLNEFKAFLDEYKLDLHKKRLVLAISCGVDSSVLLDILEKFKDEYEYEIKTTQNYEKPQLNLILKKNIVEIMRKISINCIF